MGLLWESYSGYDTAWYYLPREIFGNAVTAVSHLVANTIYLACSLVLQLSDKASAANGGSKTLRAKYYFGGVGRQC